MPFPDCESFTTRTRKTRRLRRHTDLASQWPHLSGAAGVGALRPPAPARVPGSRLRSPPSPNNGERSHQHGRARSAAATYRLQARNYGGSGSLSTSKPPSLSRERRGTDRQSPRTPMSELPATLASNTQPPSASTDKMESAATAEAGPGDSAANQNTTAQAWPMRSGPPPVAGAGRGRRRGGGAA